MVVAASCERRHGQYYLGDSVSVISGVSISLDRGRILYSIMARPYLAEILPPSHTPPFSTLTLRYINCQCHSPAFLPRPGSTEILAETIGAHLNGILPQDLMA